MSGELQIECILGTIEHRRLNFVVSLYPITLTYLTYLTSPIKQHRHAIRHVLVQLDTFVHLVPTCKHFGRLRLDFKLILLIILDNIITLNAYIIYVYGRLCAFVSIRV